MTTTTPIPDTLTLPVVEIDGRRHIVLSGAKSIAPVEFVDRVTYTRHELDDVDKVPKEEWWPKPGSVWKHKNGTLYRVSGYLNIDATKPDSPLMIVYKNILTNQKWTRRLHDWYRSFVPETETQEMAYKLLSYFSSGAITCKQWKTHGIFHEALPPGDVTGDAAAKVFVNPGHSDIVRSYFARGWESMLTSVDT